MPCSRLGSISLPSCHSFHEATRTHAGSAARAARHVASYVAPPSRGTSVPGSADRPVVEAGGDGGHEGHARRPGGGGARLVFASQVLAPGEERDRRIDVKPVEPRQPRGAGGVADQVDAPATGGEPPPHVFPHRGADPVSGVDEDHRRAGDPEKRGLVPVTVEERFEVGSDASAATAPQLAGLVVGGERQAGVPGGRQEHGEGARLLALAPPPGHQEPVEASLAGVGELLPQDGGVAAVVGAPGRGVRRSEAVPGIVDAEDALLRQGEAGVVPVTPAPRRSHRRAVPRVVHREHPAGPPHVRRRAGGGRDAPEGGPAPERAVALEPPAAPGEERRKQSQQ